MIELKGVTKRYGNCDILQEVNLRIEPKEVVVVTGPSGSGKSLLQSLLLRAEAPTNGQIFIDGVNLSTLPFTILQLFRQRLGVVFQERSLFPLRTVAENLGVTLCLRGFDKATVHTRVLSMLKILHLTEKTNLFPKQLSGAEQTLVALGSALIHDPLILLLDEPLTFLNEEQCTLALSLITERHEQQVTVVIFTLNPANFQSLSPRVVDIEKGTMLTPSPPPHTSKNIHHIFEDSPLPHPTYKVKIHGHTSKMSPKTPHSDSRIHPSPSHPNHSASNSQKGPSDPGMKVTVKNKE